MRIGTVAIIGRTNVGKSTLFNQLIGKREAIVEDRPGVTRDRHYGLVKITGKKNETREGKDQGMVVNVPPFTLIDTGGIAGEDDQDFQTQIREQVELAIEESDLVLAVFDAVSGVMAGDKEVVSLIREANKPVIWVANKCESQQASISAHEFYALGIDDIFQISAAHAINISQLREKIRERLSSLVIEGEEQNIEREQNLKITFVGRPNVGKSSLVNRILGSERVITSSIAGTTRDAIEIPFIRDGQKFLLIDTAGLRKKSKVEDNTTERYSTLRTLRALALADVAVLVLDATSGMPSDQDIRIATLIHERGRAMLIAVNKWDALEKDHTTSKAFERALKEKLSFVSYAPLVFVSALTGKRCPSIINNALKVFKNSKDRIQTAELNRSLKNIFESRPPPVYRGQPIKFFFAVQADIAPPKIVLFLNHPRKLSDGYVRYVKSSLREHFSFQGCDLKLILRKRTEKSHNEESSRN